MSGVGDAAGGLADRVREGGDARPVVLVDGRSGSGKSTLAVPLARLLDAQLVRLDGAYPGWDGLDAGSELVRSAVLDPREPGWRRWDWHAGRLAEWHPVDPDRGIVIEGCGTLSRSNRAVATFGVWVEMDAEERRRRAIARDGDEYEPHWERWARQEDAFIAREHPELLADAIVDGVTGALVLR